MTVPSADERAAAQAEADRQNRARQQVIDQRTAMETNIAELRDAAAALRSLGTRLSEPFVLAMHADADETWKGRRADEFRQRMVEVRDDLLGGKPTSIRSTLDDAARECELRATVMQSQLPLIPALAVPSFTG